jgi:spore coat polysaccharide biosynthesis protein SpsF (cytidylyltransferase family)
MIIVVVIQARTSSIRLPRKVVLDLEGKTVLERVIERVCRSNMVSKVVVATSGDNSDDIIEEICSSNSTDCFRGSLDDVLDRYYHAVKQYSADQIVRITADCPLIDPKIIDLVVKEHLSKEADYTSNTFTDTFPDGEDVEVIKMSALEEAWKRANLLSEREHVTSYIRKHGEKFVLTSVENEIDLSNMRWSLDNLEDYEFILRIYKGLFKKNPMFNMEDILEYLKANPELKKINQHIIRNEGYLKSLKEDKEIVMPARDHNG